MLQVAVIGAGPAGYYTAEALTKKLGDNVRVDMIDRLPVPYGLIRFGVAPDHQSIKAVTRRYEKVALSDNVHFIGNVTLGQDVTIDELRSLYDAVVLTTGAPVDRRLGIEGDDLPGVHGSAEFVGWYNGHPDHADLAPDLSGGNVVIVGNGNVALDCARILAKSHAELEGSDIVAHARDALDASKVSKITILGRRGPHQIAMTPKELGELGELERAWPKVEQADFPPLASDDALDPGQRKSVTLLRGFAERSGSDDQDKPIIVEFDFFASPVAIGGTDKVESILVERTELDDAGKAHGTGEQYRLPASMVISCIGYQTPAIAGAAYDDKAGRFANEEGRMGDGLYCAGWARRGPTGTIGTNKPDGYMIADHIAEDLGEGAGKPGHDGLLGLLKERGVDPVRFRDWQRIDQAEVSRAMNGAPREKFVVIEDMLKALASDRAD